MAIRVRLKNMLRGITILDLAAALLLAAAIFLFVSGFGEIPQSMPLAN